MAIHCCTTESIPGFTVVRTIGLVMGYGVGFGGFAAERGQTALERAHALLVEQAEALGANAVVGVSLAPFSADDGEVMGGTVGMVMLGTAVVATAVAGTDPLSSLPPPDPADWSPWRP